MGLNKAPSRLAGVEILPPRQFVKRIYVLCPKQSPGLFPIYREVTQTAQNNVKSN